MDVFPNLDRFLDEIAHHRRKRYAFLLGEVTDRVEQRFLKDHVDPRISRGHRYLLRLLKVYHFGRTVVSVPFGERGSSPPLCPVSFCTPPAGRHFTRAGSQSATHGDPAFSRGAGLVLTPSAGFFHL